jgi:uncharacterized protein with von Willebrand factor type A (vWA) domain
MKVYILLDKSGSMATQWSDTLGAINGYVQNLPPETAVYLAAFSGSAFGWNTESDYKVLRNEPAESFSKVTNEEVSPGGGTPLLDSLAQLLDLAFSESPDRAYIVIMTDGEENSSRKYNKQVIQEKLARAEDRNWEVVFLGANFDNVHDQARGIGLAATKSLNIGLGNYQAELNNLSTMTCSYASTGARTNFTSEDQKRATKKK